MLFYTELISSNQDRDGSFQSSKSDRSSDEKTREKSRSFDSRHWTKHREGSGAKVSGWEKCENDGNGSREFSDEMRATAPAWN